MNEPQLQRIEELFHAAADLPAAARSELLDRECASAPELRARLEAMLEQADRDETLLAPSPAEGPRELVEGPGTVIDRYKLLQVIGEGGFGVVYMAEQQQPVVRKVALKIIKLGMDTREVVARFEAERQALAMMDHPSIAKVLDGGATATGRPYFVMELVRGVAITDYCDRNNLSTRERLELFAEVCQAVQHAHQKGVIHRDIKPSNVMVTLHDGRPVAKVIDFGVAKAMHARLTDKTLFTAYQHFIGTPAYMSPEQAEMSGLDIDTRTDIYSLGVLLYELLTGTTPFDTSSLLGAGIAEIQRILREEQPPRPSLRISTSAEATVAARRRQVDAAGLSKLLRGDLDWIVMKALEKDRTRRYAAASDLAADVRRHLNDEPVEASPPSAAYRLRKLLVRHRAWVASAALVALALVGGILGTGLGMLEAARQRDVARHEAEHARVVTDFLVDNLELSDPEVALQPEVTVRTLLDRASAQVAERFAGQPQAEARMRATIGRSYESLGEHRLAEVHLRRAVELFDRIGVSDPADFYDVLWTLVNVLFRLDHDDAYAFVQRARQVGHDHIRSRHAELASKLDRFLAEIDEHKLAADPADLEPAGLLFADAARTAERVLEPGDPLWPIVADSFLSAGYSLWYTPNEASGEPFFAETLKIQQRELGPGHPTTAETLGVLAGVLNRAGKAAEAESRLRDSLEAMRRTYPPGNFHLGLAESMLGANLAAQGRYAEAEPLLLSGHEVMTAHFGDESHFFLVDSYGRMIELYDGWGRPQEVAPYRAAFARYVATYKWPSGWPIAHLAFGPEHAGLSERLDRLRQLVGGLSYAAKAGRTRATGLTPLLDEIFALRRRTLDGDDPRAAIVARLLLGWSNALAPGADDESRRRMTAEALAILRHWQDDIPLDVADALAQLSELALAAGNVERAAALARESWTVARDSAAGDSWYVANAEVRVARCLVRQGLLSEAEALLVSAHEVLVAQLGPSHSDTREARIQLFALYTAWGKPQQAAAFAPGG